MTHPRAIIFDLDGTLIDSINDITNALNHALAQLHLARVDARDARGWIGDGLRELCRRALAHRHAPQHIDAIVEGTRIAYQCVPVAETACYPNVLTLLDLLRARGLRRAVLTNKPHTLATRIMGMLALRERVDTIRGFVSEETKKPSPVQALEIADELGLAPQHCAIVGDSIVDIATARNAGMTAFAALWGYQEKSYLAEARPDALLDNPLDLIRLLELD